MADEFPQAFKRYCEGLMYYCKSVTWTSYFEGKVKFKTEPDDEEERDATKAQIHINTVYSYYSVRVSKFLVEHWEEKDYEYCGHAIMHEHCHILVEPLARLSKMGCTPSQDWMGKEIVEQTVERIARALEDRLPKNWFLPEHIEEWAEKVGAAIITPKLKRSRRYHDRKTY